MGLGVDQEISRMIGFQSDGDLQLYLATTYSTNLNYEVTLK
jgi:hypothetical protein